MNVRSPHRPTSQARGFTLLEACVTLGVIALTVPLILAATSLSARTRMNAEADTRSAWLARTVQEELTDAWRNQPTTLFPSKPAFPNFASAAEPELLLFDQDGNFLTRGSVNDHANGSSHNKAVYLLSLHTTEHKPANILSNQNDLTRVEITVTHPARAPLAKRTTFSYIVLIPRQTAP